MYNCCLVSGAMFYAVGSELFSGNSVNGVYSKALKRCKNDSEVWVFSFL